ncbi:hypothetical protein FCU45_08670 [Sulfurimonas crateris]|uniref:Uncharacterized protein n=1 Tax=Sulfurimonas crateris TaxID=2574727 RepID=A0A4U2Z592_9BACT|nr:hypothetical protein [Sulfurimonas crateris]TKI69024.1 hypothetical protein FCU45_08670 [Sulfurimonas crateris]
MALEIFKLSIILGFALVLLHFSALKRGQKPSLWTILFIFMGSFVFVTILSYLFALYDNSAVKEKRRAFYDENSFICETGAFKKKEHYLVSIKEGWSVYEDSYFKKEDLLLEIINCEQKR